MGPIVRWPQFADFPICTGTDFFKFGWHDGCARVDEGIQLVNYSNRLTQSDRIESSFQIDFNRIEEFNLIGFQFGLLFILCTRVVALYKVDTPMDRPWAPIGAPASEGSLLWPPIDSFSLFACPISRTISIISNLNFIYLTILL